jgi:hypothetical protein
MIVHIPAATAFVQFQKVAVYRCFLNVPNIQKASTGRLFLDLNAKDVPDLQTHFARVMQKMRLYTFNDPKSGYR